MASEPSARINLDIRDSVPDWTPYLPPKAPDGAPNVLYITWDDLGYGTMDVFGGPVKTPNMQRIADMGVKFSNFHTTALCSPTRSSMLTGRNATSNGMATIAEFSAGFPGISTRIPFENGFISEVLVERGYNTYCVGKWHLTPGEECNLAAYKGRWPLGRGFERFYGFLGGESNQWYPDLVQDNSQIDAPGTPEEGYHLSKDLADQAIGMIKSAKVIDPDKPFFMYLAPGCGHAPHHVPTEWADKYKGVFDHGYEAIRSEILARQQELGLLPDDTQLSAINPHGEPERTGPDGQPWPLLDTVRPWDSLTSDEQRLFARMAEVFAGFVSYTDDQVGRVLDYLEESGQLDNTIVVVVSDNGASGEGGPNGSFNEWRFFNGVPDTTESTLPHIDDLGTPRSYNHYCTGWAWAFDTPFPYWKRWAGYEGGVADMCMVVWPAQIKASEEVRHQYIHAVDIVPTVYDLLGIEPPAVIKGYTQTPIEGESFAAALTDPSVPGKSTQFYTMLGQRAIYHEGWLACTVHPPIGGWGNFEHDEWELYDLEHDRAQSKNVAADHPEQLADAAESVVLLRGDLQGSSARRPHCVRAGDLGTSSRWTGPSAVHVLPRCRRRARVVRGRDQRTVVHDRRGRRHRHCRRRGCAVRARWRRRRPQSLRQGQEAAVRVQLDRHEDVRRRRRHRHHAGQARAHRGVRVEGSEHRPDDPGVRGHALALPRHAEGRRGRDRHPARQLLPGGRRAVHRT